MNIFVAKLNYSTQTESLQDLFEGFGDVDSAKIIMDRETGRSKGFGFVEMPNDAEALAAIEELNDSDFEGSQIVVKKANPSPGNDRRGGGGGFRGGGRDRGGYGGGGRDRGGYGGGGRDRRY
jgi:RNA recognition motif-containing protein